MRRGCALIGLLVSGCGRLGFDARGDGGGDGGSELRLAPEVETINVGSETALLVEGGVPPYQFALVGGEGWLAPGGTFFAPTRAGTTTIRVTDQTSATATATVRYEGARLILAGGVTSTSVATVWTSTDAATWSVLGSLPAPRSNGAMVVYRDRLYYLGGNDTGGGQTDTIFTSIDGEAWTGAGTLPGPRSALAVAVHAGAVWIVGGYSGSNRGDVYRSTDLATWTRVADLPVPTHELDAVSRGDTLYVLGGHTDGGFTTDVASTTDGAQWTTIPDVLNFTTDFPGVGELGDRVFRVCGDSCAGAETSTDLVTWTPAAPIGVTLDGPALVGFRGELLVIGGGGTTVRATVDGSAWSTRGDLPEAVGRSVVVQFTPP